jgi:hypothetical protein
LAHFNRAVCSPFSRPAGAPSLVASLLLAPFLLFFWCLLSLPFLLSLCGVARRVSAFLLAHFNRAVCSPCSRPAGAASVAHACNRCSCHSFCSFKI